MARGQATELCHSVRSKGCSSGCYREDGMVREESGGIWGVSSESLDDFKQHMINTEKKPTSWPRASLFSYIITQLRFTVVKTSITSI